MSNSTIFLSIIIALFFAVYGIQCLRSPFMIKEFVRYGMNDSLRKLTGITQLLGACGLVAGLYISIIGFFAAAGLSFMMLIAFITRLKIRDSLNQALPSFFFMTVNGYLAIRYLMLLLNDL
ncbi:DoxX family protein [Rhodohalobacter sulfatireducens]|uniref:DoxX family protein n=1 Tax=Rhodohalobacter sulfatireducens TaxID=2911366 RepID=A0ABS9KDZ6_9BACT|nr:DoxX family protein [Rhodohalobacter sulfatireducens]MCG2589083.1 DoxX family protein [Rhodohalobacter sulfatireducens]